MQPTALNTYKGTVDLSEAIPVRELEVKVDVGKSKHELAKQYTRLENMHRKVLEEAKNEFSNATKNKTQNTEIDEGINQIKFIVARPPTPVWSYDDNFNLR